MGSVGAGGEVFITISACGGAGLTCCGACTEVTNVAARSWVTGVCWIGATEARDAAVLLVFELLFIPQWQRCRHRFRA